MGMKYKCSICGGIFESDWSDAEAITEVEKNFGDVPVSSCDIVCDDCYKRITGGGIIQGD